MMSKTLRGLNPKGQDSLAEPSDTVVDSARPPRSDSRSLVGTVLKEKYQLVKPLAAGSMGTVWEARHLALQRRFAVKMLSIDSSQQADALPRFKREAELASAIGHENIVEIIDIDRTEDDQWYIVMELLEGIELREMMYQEKKLVAEDVAAIARQLGSAVDAAHAQGIVHRDLKPENIFILEGKKDSSEVEVKVLDFGISKVRNADTALTRPGEVIGTPFYMAPEQARGDRSIDHRADLFALGAVFYEAMTGIAPFQGKTPNEVLRSILLDDVTSPREFNPELSTEICDVLIKALAKEPEDRFQSGTEMAEALARAILGRPVEEIDSIKSTVKPTTEPSVPPRSGFKTIHLVLAFTAGVIITGLTVYLMMKM